MFKKNILELNLLFVASTAFLFHHKKMIFDHHKKQQTIAANF
jgi:hypothetical protein